MMYRETQNEKYLQQAINIAKFILHHPNLPEDKIPYWDFDAPNIPDEPRDASAGAIIASALLELGQYVNDDKLSVVLVCQLFIVNGDSIAKIFAYICNV